MTAVSRTAQFAKVHKVLKKYYKASPCNSGRTVIEHLLFACCLEDAHHDAAEEAFAALVHTFFDWNEVRVTSISELSEVMACLPDPHAAANRIKRMLHAVFESTFNFDLEDRRKKNLGPTIKWLEKLDGSSHFTVAYVIQAALAGHAIPIDAGTMAVLRLLDLVTDKDVTAGAVPGLERAVAKSKGIEFGSMLHELGADYSANPYSSSVRDILRQIDPECEGRLPKRRTDRAARKPQEAPHPAKAHPAATPPAQPKSKSAGASEKPSTHKKPASADAPSTPHESAKKKTPPPEAHTKAGAADKKLPPRTASPRKQPASEGLSKRKPR
jgi:endonuclease III